MLCVEGRKALFPELTKKISTENGLEKDGLTK